MSKTVKSTVPALVTPKVTEYVAPASSVAAARLALVKEEGKLETVRGAYAVALYALLKSHNGKISGPELKGKLKEIYTAERKAFMKLCESRKLSHPGQRWDAVVKCMQGMRAGTHSPDTGKPMDDKRKNNGKGKGKKPEARALDTRVTEELNKLWRAYMSDEHTELSPKLVACMEKVADGLEALGVTLSPARN